jgi:hypothetical protein
MAAPAAVPAAAAVVVGIVATASVVVGRLADATEVTAPPAVRSPVASPAAVEVAAAAAEKIEASSGGVSGNQPLGDWLRADDPGLPGGGLFLGWRSANQVKTCKEIWRQEFICLRTPRLLFVWSGKSIFVGSESGQTHSV